MRFASRLPQSSKHRTVALLALLIATAPALARAQVTTTGIIRVAVTDQGDLPIPGATVTAAAEDAATTRIGFTDTAGLAELRALSPSARYVVTVELSGFRASRQADVLVRAGQTVSLAVSLTVGNVAETVVVTAAPPVVDVTSAVVAEDITLDLTEAVPTGRSYQSYLQLVPGVLPDDPESPGNPASKSGLNYPGTAGADRRHPGRVRRRAGAAVERHHQVGHQPAQRLGQLLLPEWLTGGGPIVTDEAWFFGSYRRVGRNDTVVALDGIDVIRTVEEAQDQFYARGTWAPSTNNTGRSKTSSSAASGSTTSTSATPRATRTPRWCRPAGTPSTAA